MHKHAVLVDDLLNELSGRRRRRELQRHRLARVVVHDLHRGRPEDLADLVAHVHLEYVSGVHVNEQCRRR